MLCAVLISVIFCRSMADRWPGSNWWFWYNPIWIVPNAPVITGTIFVLTFHILLTLISSSSYLLSFSVIIIIIASIFHNYYLSYIITVILIDNYANFSFYIKFKFPVPPPPPGMPYQIRFVPKHAHTPRPVANISRSNSFSKVVLTCATRNNGQLVGICLKLPAGQPKN
jgi:hypothetical protein